MSLSKTLHSLLSTGLTQEDSSRHDLKIVDTGQQQQQQQTVQRNLSHILTCIYSVKSKALPELRFFSVAVFMYDFLQNNNKYVTQVFPQAVKPARMSFDTFVKILWCPVYTNPYFWGIPFNAL